MLLVSVATAGASATRAFVGARILPVSSPPIEAGVLVVAEGRIVAVGALGEVAIPPAAEVRDLTGKVLIPGLVDTHSHVADVSGGDRSAALHPEVRALDGVDVRADTIGKARAGGITTVNVMPGSGYLMSGQTVYLKLRAGLGSVEDAVVCDATGAICGGMKMANGTNSQDRGDGFPGARGKAAAMVREMFEKAAERRSARERATEGSGDVPPRDLGLDALLEVLDRRRIVHFHTHRADDIATVLRLARELGFRVVLHHVSEGYLVADAIASAGAGCSINVVDAPGGKHENSERRLETPGILVRAGVDVAISTDDSITDSRFLLRSAALAMRGGLAADRALEAVTLAGARLLGLEHRLGSLAAGKDADFVVLSGEPFSSRTLVEETWVEGERVFDRAGETRMYQVGGYGVYRGSGAEHVH